MGYFWLNIAAAAGHEKAVKLRDWAVTVLTQDQIRRAQEAVRKWATR